MLFHLVSAGAGGQLSRRVLLNYKTDDDKGKNTQFVEKKGLKPLESELLRVEQIALQVAGESDHQRDREATHRDTSGMSPPILWPSFLPPIFNSNTPSSPVRMHFVIAQNL